MKAMVSWYLPRLRVLALLAAVAAYLGCSSNNSGINQEPGFEIRGTVQDATTHLPIRDVAIAIGSTSDTSSWAPLVGTDSTGAWSYGSIGSLAYLQARFSKGGYDTLRVILADSAVVERSESGTTWYRFNPQLRRTHVPMPAAGPRH